MLEGQLRLSCGERFQVNVELAGIINNILKHKADEVLAVLVTRAVVRPGQSPESLFPGFAQPHNSAYHQDSPDFICLVF